eukprot:529076_1
MLPMLPMLLIDTKSTKCVLAGYFAKPLKFSNYEFLIAPEKTQRDNSKGVYKYNTLTNEWSVCIEYNKDMESSYHTAAFDVSKHVLYSYDAQSQLIKINFQTKQIQISKHFSDMQYIYPSSVIINHQFHVILGQNNNKHLIWNDTKQQFKQIYVFEEFIQGYSNHGLIYISSKQMLLLFGGYNHDIKSAVDYIYSYSINNNKWTKLNVCLPVPMKGFGYVLTNTEQYVIIFASSSVYVWDLYTMEIKKIQMTVNMTYNYCRAILMYDYIKDECLSYGYIRRCWQCTSFNDIQYPSNDLIQLIKLFCPSVGANIHVLSIGNGYYHFKFKLSDIIPGLCLCS